jgi:carboxypeptidase C (cathepsin A)
MNKGIPFLLLLFLLPVSAGLAEGPKGKKMTAQPATESESAAPGEGAKESLSITHHSIIMDGRRIPYTATTGRLSIADTSGKQEGDIFFIAYTLEVAGSPSSRPVTFAFNGGPGASSVWLNLGAFGPKRVALPDRGMPVPPPYQLVDNVYSLLDVTDLVFVDPIGTGFSRPAPGVEAKKFYGMKGDAESIGEFVRRYVTRFERWDSPKFLAGESYGTVRAVLLANRLHSAYGMDVNGLILISSAIDFQNFAFGANNILPYVVYLPSYTAAAYYHKVLPGQPSALQEILREAEKWTLNEYLPALSKGDGLEEAEREEVIQKLRGFTGLSETYIRQKKLKINNLEFAKELLRSRNLSLGILDSRLTGKDEPGGSFLDEPSMVLTIGPLVALLNDHLRRDLKYASDLPYEYFSQQANSAWDWGSAIGGYPSVTRKLGHMIQRFGYLKVFIARGYYDLDVPYFATPYNLAHLGIDPTLRDDVRASFYEAGHQMYTDPASLKKLKSDLSAFIEAR